MQDTEEILYVRYRIFVGNGDCVRASIVTTRSPGSVAILHHVKRRRYSCFLTVGKFLYLGSPRIPSLPPEICRKVILSISMTLEVHK